MNTLKQIAANFMQPRIYTYKITFEEIPHWYWGVHKERKFGEEYWGTPITNSWVWEFYTPKIQILEFFPYTNEGWLEANSIEDRLIKPDLNNSLCLNEAYGGRISLVTARKGGLLTGPIPVWNNGVIQIKSWDCPGSLWVRGNIPHPNTLETLKNNGKLPWWTDGTSEKRSYKTPGEGWEQGRLSKPLTPNFNWESSRISGKKSMSLKYMDPDHPELGQKAAPVLVRMQKSRGYPHQPSNRVLLK